MHDLTILSIFRDSADYLERYGRQVMAVMAAIPKWHFQFIWLEGDSRDDTRRILDVLWRDVRAAGATGMIGTYNHGGPAYPSIDNPDRWRQLAGVWNRNLDRLAPTRYAVCVESDLIWQPEDMLHCIGMIEAGMCDVAYPLLMLRDTEQFYDTHAYKALDGSPWSAWAPYAPGWRGERYVPVREAGGMVVATGAVMQEARWGDDDCVLHFPAGTRCLVDMHTRIRHP